MLTKEIPIQIGFLCMSLLLKTGFHVRSKLRNDADLCYKLTGNTQEKLEKVDLQEK